ncbi:hypothetical protein Bbelb_013600 [Branchiostoma belcheri]|nr:hypothetical protein Bbelb_013600 [Branchiostoma belcheri]
MSAAVSHFPLGANRLEDEIRTVAQTKRVRVSEFFKDFDRLRSGFITASQFKRCLDQNLGIQLTPQDEVMLLDKYDLKREGMVNYRLFTDVIDQAFNPNDMTPTPEAQAVTPVEFLGTQRSLRPLSPGSQQRVRDILERMQPFYKYHGINLRTSYEDFDRHHIGVVTESQFYRSFPGPPDITDDEKYLLACRYADPDRPGLCNYLNLHHDLEQVAEDLRDPGISPPSDPLPTYGWWPAEAPADPVIRELFEKIRKAVYKNGIRTIEFFRDHDKLRSGIITENQFVCGLALAVGKEANLARTEIQKLADYYKTEDGRVRYREFCDIMENAYNVPDLEKKPTVDPVRPPRGALTRSLNPLTQEEENRVQEVLEEMRETARKRRLMMYPYFKDYDRGIAYTRNVTKSQFGRILHFLSLNINPPDFKLLCRKFEEPISGDVNYPAFVQAVDKEFTGFTVDQESPKPMVTPELDISTLPINTSHVNLGEVIARIRHHAVVNRIRVAEFFQDFDPLRSGSITKPIFRRGLCLMGFPDMPSDQFAALAEHYIDPKQPDKVVWTRFHDEIESAFTQKGLEKTPTHAVPSTEVFQMSKPGTLHWEAQAPDDWKSVVDAAMHRMREKAAQRRLLSKPVFQDFDRHNYGYVTLSQFRQCLTYLSLDATEEEAAAIEAKFSDKTGFNYLRFLAELQPTPAQEKMYEKRLQELTLVNQQKQLPEMNAAPDLGGVMFKIKDKVAKERTRVLEWMRDYDKLRTGRMKKNSFRRALDLCKFELKPSEVAILEREFQSPVDPDFVEYLRFSDEVESIFTIKELEKMPEVTPQQFKPPVEWQLNVLSEENEAMVKVTMERIAEKVKKHRMQLFPPFEDFDRVNNGTVSRSQFKRVLTELELGSLVNHREYVSLFQKFMVRVGGREDVNYIAFCEMVYAIAGFEWRKP